MQWAHHLDYLGKWQVVKCYTSGRCFMITSKMHYSLFWWCSIFLLFIVGSSDPLTLRHRRRRDSVNSLSSDVTTPSIHQDSLHCPVAHNLEPEIWKTAISVLYFFLVTWITAIVMVIVHDRVPDMEKYPPLPDIFLDNVPYIPWAFDMCEITACVLGIIWLTILVFHKHRWVSCQSRDIELLLREIIVMKWFFDDDFSRFILLRRMFALFGSVFLLRCITMLITSLSVPGRHLDCKARVGMHYILGWGGHSDV